MITLVLLGSLLISCAQCKRIWVYDLPALYDVTLEQGKPLQLEYNFTKIQLMNLNGTLDAQFLSQLAVLAPVTDVRLYLTHITKIEAGAVCSSPTLRRFELSFNKNANVPILRRNIFENCEKLEELNLVGAYGHHSKLEPNAFLNLTNLKNLNLLFLDLHHLKKEYFSGLKSLTYLSIIHCNVQRFDEDTFYELDSLKELVIVFNSKFSHLPMNLFKKARNLETLFLFANNITDLTWDEFEGLSSLRELHIGHNNISSFDADKIAQNMPNLSIFYSEMGPTELERKHFELQLQSKLDHNVTVWFLFDPTYYAELADRKIFYRDALISLTI